MQPATATKIYVQERLSEHVIWKITEKAMDKIYDFLEKPF